MKKILSVLLCLGILTACGQSEIHGIASKEGDVVKIDFVGKLDGDAFQGGTAQGYLLELGSGSFIDGFEDQVVGIETGETKTITVTFPKNYQSTDLAGKDCTFDVTVHQVYQETQDACQKGDVVKIDFVGKLDGVAFQGGTGQGYLLELGSGSFIDGFEEQLVGMKNGETKTITVTFPSQYGSTYINGEVVDLSNQKATFDVAVNHVYREAK